MQLKELAVLNYGNIAKAKLDLDYQGITFFLGKNKDAGPGATNGAGKSQFWSAIPEIGYSTPPSGKDGHKHNKAKIRLTLSSGDNTYVYTKAFSKTGSKSFTVVKNGKDVNVRTLDYAQKKLRALLGKTEEDFYTRVYVDALQAHPLIVGSAAQRQEFFVRMFSLENVDSMRKLLLAELNLVQKSAASYREVKSLFDEAKSNLKTTSEERGALAKQILDLRSKRDTLISKAEELQHVRDLLAFEHDNAKQLKRFRRLTSPSSFQDDLAKSKSSVRKYKGLRESALDWKSYAKELETYTAEATRTKAKVEALLGSDYTKADLRTKAEAFELCVKEQGVIASKLDDYAQADKPETVSNPKYTLDQCKRKIADLKDELSHSKEFHNGKCPTCGSKVEARTEATIREDLSKWNRRLLHAKDYDEYVTASAEYKETERKRKELQDKLENITAKLAKHAPYAKAYKMIQSLPIAPQEPDSAKVSLRKVEDRLDEAQAELAFLESMEPLVERIVALDKVTDSQRASVENYSKVSQRLTVINTELTAKEAFKVQQDEAVKQLAHLRTKGKVLKRQAEDEEILKELVVAYSAKGIKKLLIQRYASLLQRQVNKYVRFVFSEDFSFEFRYETKLEVLVHRKYGKTVKTTDVKRLSGAEKKMFTLLLVIAGYTITPVKQRSNILILDELEANMGPEAVKNFLRMLPVLNKIIPHIVVITPRPELHLEGARYFTAVKHRGVTSIVEGRQ